MAYSDDLTRRGLPLITHWRGAKYLPFRVLTNAQQQEVRKTWNPNGRREGWENPERWAFCFKANGERSQCPYIEPLTTPAE